MDIEHEVMRQQGIGNFRNDDIRVNIDRPHDDWPSHVDMTVRLGTGISGCGAHKIRVDREGHIISDDIV